MFFFIAFSFQLTFFFLFLQQEMKQFRVHGVINKPKSVEQKGGGGGRGKVDFVWNLASVSWKA